MYTLVLWNTYQGYRNSGSFPVSLGSRIRQAVKFPGLVLSTGGFVGMTSGGGVVRHTHGRFRAVGPELFNIRRWKIKRKKKARGHGRREWNLDTLTATLPIVTLVEPENPGSQVRLHELPVALIGLSSDEVHSIKGYVRWAIPADQRRYAIVL
jgi:hypothetical protein